MDEDSKTLINSPLAMPVIANPRGRAGSDTALAPPAEADALCIVHRASRTWLTASTLPLAAATPARRLTWLSGIGSLIGPVGQWKSAVYVMHACRIRRGLVGWTPG
jgi:hypothetical protein